MKTPDESSTHAPGELSAPVPGAAAHGGGTGPGKLVVKGGLGALAITALGAVIGAFVGASAYTAHYAKATSYLSDDPRACVNCHIMNDQYNAWSSSSHHSRATCNDCHVPHDSMLSKYMVKAEHGYRHSKGFTLNDFHEPIRMTPSSRDVVIDNCVRCHDAMTHEIRLAARPDGSSRGDATMGSGAVDCLHCHASVAHGSTR